MLSATHSTELEVDSEYISTILSYENIKKRGFFDPESIKNLILKKNVMMSLQQTQIQK